MLGSVGLLFSSISPVARETRHWRVIHRDCNAGSINIRKRRRGKKEEERRRFLAVDIRDIESRAELFLFN